MTSPATVIRIEDLTKRFGSVTAIDSVSLEFQENEFFALLGPSGCGKTTLLRVIAGFEHPDEGRVLLDGEDMTALRPNRRPVNLMFQSYALFPHMSVEKNIAYGLEMEDLPRDRITRRVDDIIAMTELTDLCRRRPHQLSGGQRQRVALARALVKKPRVLLLDEPLGALDKKLREQMQLELKRLQHDAGITFVVVTHDQDEALVMADRIAVLKDGRVAQLGSPRALYERPENRFVADFIGVMNFFDGRMAAGRLRVDGHDVLTATETPAMNEGAPATCAVRPERVTLAAERPRDYGNAVAGTVVDVAYHGQDLNVHVSVENVARQVLARLPARTAEEADWRAGQAVWCCWDPAHSRILTE